MLKVALQVGPGFDQLAITWHADEGIIGDLGDGFKGDVTPGLNGPFVVLFEEDGADQSGNGLVVGENADDI